MRVLQQRSDGAGHKAAQTTATAGRRRTDRLTALTLAGLLAAIAVPILIVTLALVMQRPDGWVEPGVRPVTGTSRLFRASRLVSEL